ncbi:MAG: ribbon-helix-helix domain-containing protein [Candidatus Woesearchaeota archaeon]
MQSITIKLDDAMAQSMQKHLKPYYSTKTEFIREAIRDKLKQLEQEYITLQLKKLQGSVVDKGVRLTEKDYERMLEELTPEKSLELFRQFNLEGVPRARKVNNVSRNKKRN